MEAVGRRKRIGLVAHDNKKRDLIEWSRYNRILLERHDLVATGTTGTLLEDALGVGIEKLQSGPLGHQAAAALPGHRQRLIEGQLADICLARARLLCTLGVGPAFRHQLSDRRRDGDDEKHDPNHCAASAA